MTTDIRQLPSTAKPGYYNECSGALSIVVPQESTNFIDSPSFELYDEAILPALSKWQVVKESGAVVSIPSYIVTGEQAWSGASAVKTQTISSPFARLRYTSVSIPSIANTRVAFSFYIRGVTGSGARAWTATIRTTGDVVIASSPFTIAEGQWQRVQMMWIPTTTAFIVSIDKSLDGSGSYKGGDAYIDAVQVELVPIIDPVLGISTALGATTYFDGSTTGYYRYGASQAEYSWAGYPHRSLSYRNQQTTHGGRIYNLQDIAGLTIVGVYEAAMTQPQNQTVVFNTADGAQLTNVINPTRTITYVGRVNGIDAQDFARKMSKLNAFFSRDVSSLRLVRRFEFQHLDSRERIGVPLTHHAAFAGGLNVAVVDTMTADVQITLDMYDPYFYGHDESVAMTAPRQEDIGGGFGGIFSSFGRDDVVGSATPYLIQKLGAGISGDIYAFAVDRSGTVWLGGNFLDTMTGTTLNNIATYDPITNTVSPIIVGGVTGVNSYVFDINIAPNGHVWIGGQFTSAGGVAGTAYVAYYNGTTWVSFGGAVSATVNRVTIRPIIEATTGAGYPYRVVIGGQFTTIGGANRYRIARSSTTASAWDAIGTGAGFSSVVNSLVWHPTEDAYYVGGAYQTTQGGAVTCWGLAKISNGTGTTANLGYGLQSGGGTPSIYDLLVDADGTIVIGGIWTTIINISTGGTTAYANALAYYSQGILKTWPSYAGTTQVGEVRALQTIRGGICISGEFSATFARSVLQIWNGTVLNGSGFVPVGDAMVAPTASEMTYVAIEGQNGTIYVGAASNTGNTVPTTRVFKTTNTSTVAVRPQIRLFFNTDGQPAWVMNTTNRKTISIGPFAQALNAFNRTDMVVYDTDAMTAVSYLAGNIARTIGPVSQFATFTIEPGTAYLNYADLAQATTGATNAINQADIIWPQTFQSLFDGVTRS
jgi:hypothetical protein